VDASVDSPSEHPVAVRHRIEPESKQKLQSALRPLGSIEQSKKHRMDLQRRRPSLGRTGVAGPLECGHTTSTGLPPTRLEASVDTCA